MNSKDLNSIAEAYAKMNIRGNDSEEQKKRLEKKRGMKLDDHPQFKKEDLEQIDEKGMNPGFKAYLEKQKKKGGDKEEGDAPKGGGKPDFIDLDKDGDKKESMKKAAQDKKKGMGEQVHLNDISKTYLDQVANNGDEVVDEALTGQRQMRARDMKGTPYQKGGGKRTARDNKTLHNLATRNEGPGTPGYEKKTGGKGGKKFAGYGDQGAGNKAARRAGNEPMRGNRDPRNEELEATGLFSEKEIAAIDEAMSSYDRNRKRAAQRAADRNAARASGKTGVVPGVGYVSPRKEKESYTDEKGTERHKSGAKMP